MPDRWRETEAGAPSAGAPVLIALRACAGLLPRGADLPAIKGPMKQARGQSSSTVRGKIDSKPSAYLQSRPPDIPPELRLKWLARCWATRV